jgi:hypothetical protein
MLQIPRHAAKAHRAGTRERVGEESADGVKAIRSGGIAAFTLLVVIVAGSVVGANILSSATPLLVALVLAYALAAWVLWTTKGLFNRYADRSADVPIVALIAYPPLAAAAVLFLGRTVLFEPLAHGSVTPVGMALAAQMAVVLIGAVLGFWAAARAVRFGARNAAGVWRAAGIVYAIGWSLFATGPVWVLGEFAAKLAGLDARSEFSLFDAGLIMFGGAVVVAAGWVCHGVSLLISAARMNRG